MIYLLYYVADLGFVGVCISTNLMFMTRFIVNLGVVLYAGIFPKFDDIRLLSKQTVTGYDAQLKMCLNSLSMGVWGWWAFDIFTLIASYLHATVIAAQTILRSIGLITFMLPVGIMSSCGTLIGNSIGEGRSDKALSYYKTSMLLGFIIAFGQVLFLVLGVDLCVMIFTNQENIAEQMKLAWPIL